MYSKIRHIISQTTPYLMSIGKGWCFKMENEKIIKLAKEILNLDRKRDEMYEELMIMAGNKGFEILRNLQNGCILPHHR
jgi:hypothetical protein